MKRLNNFLLLCLFGILCTVASAMAQVENPSIQAKNIVFYGSNANGYIVRCTRGNGNGRVLVAQKLEGSETASGVVWLNADQLQTEVSNFSGADQPAEYSLATLTTEPVIVANLTGTNREVTVTGLNGGENIAYRVYEYNVSNGVYSFNIAPSTLNPRAKTFVAQVASITLNEAVPACSTMAASWTKSGTFDYYELDVITDGLVAVPPYTNFDIGNETSYLIEGLNPTTSYSWRISGYYGNNVVTSDWQTKTTLTTCDAPALSTTTLPKVYVGGIEKNSKTINAATIKTINALDDTATPFELKLTFNQAMDPALGSVVLNSDADNTNNTFTEKARSWSNDNKTLTLIYTIGTTADEADIKATLNGFANVDGIAITANTATDPLFSIDVTAPTATLTLTVAAGTGATPTTGYAIKGNVITATIAAGEAIVKPDDLSLKIGENETPIACSEFNATETTGDDANKIWTATYTVPTYDAQTPANSPQGLVALAASFKVKDLAGNVSGEIADYLYDAGNAGITVDTKAPTATLKLTVENGTGDTPTTGYAITGNVITATIEASEAIAKPEDFSLNVGTGTIAFTNITSSFPTGDDANKVWTATYTVVAGETPDGVIAMPTAAVTVTDLAGNVSGAIADYVYGADNNYLTIDASAPTLTVKFSATNEFAAGKAGATSCTTTESVSAPTYYNNSTEDNLVITVAANEPVTKPDCITAIENISWQACTVESEVWTPSDQQPSEGETAQYWRGTYTYTEEPEPGTITTPSVTANAVSGLASAPTAATGTVTVATTAPTLTVKKIYSDLTNDKSKAGLTNKITIVLSSTEAIYYPTNLVLKEDAETPKEFDLCFAPADYSNTVGTKITANVPEICTYWIAEVPVSSLTNYTFINDKLSANNIAVKSETLGGAYNEKGILADPTFKDNNSIGDVTIFLTAPVITNLTLISNNNNDNKLAKEGDVITLTLTTDEEYPVDEVTITPTVTVATTPTATPITFTPTYATSGRFKKWTLTHTVTADDPEGALSADVAFTYLYNAAAKTTADNGDVTIDRTAPSVTSLVASVKTSTNTDRTDGWAVKDDIITFTLTASEAIATPTAEFTVGGSDITQSNITWTTPTEGNGKDIVWTATYTVPAYVDATSPQGVVALAANFTVKDLAGNESAACSTFAVAGDITGGKITVDTKGPSVNSLEVSVASADKSARVDGWAQAGDVITFTLTADEAIAAPTAAFKVGTTQIETTNWASDADKKIWTATYTVPAYVDATSPQGVVALNGTTCTLTDLAGNTADANAAVTFDVEGGNVDDVTVDTKVPTATLAVSVTSAGNARTDGWAVKDDIITFTLTADEALKEAPTATFKVGETEITLSPNWASDADKKIWTATYTVVENSPQGLVALKDATYIVTDLAGNLSTTSTTFTTVPAAGITVDTKAPVVTITKVKGAAYNADAATIYVDDVCTFEYNVVEYNAGATTVALGENTTQLPTPTSNPVNFNELTGWSSIDGAFNLTVASTDAAGNKGTTTIRNLTKRAGLAQPTLSCKDGNNNAVTTGSTICVGTAYTLSVSNTAGTYPNGTTYEWYKGGNKIDDQTGASLSVSAGSETAPTTYTYTVKAVNADYCTTTSAASADFVVTVKPSMAQPTIAKAAANSGITTVAGVNYACAAGFTLTASTTDNLNTTQAYLWYSKDVADADYVEINGETTASLAQTDMTAGKHYYKVVAQKGDNYCSNSAESEEYVVIINPTNFTVGITGTYKEAETSSNESIVDNTITSGLPYSITLTGAIPELAPEVISYQWQKKTTGGTYSNLLAATATTKALTVNITQFGIYDYRLIVTTIDGCQTTRTQDFTLNVLQPLGTATLAATSAAICPEEETTSVTATLNLSEVPEFALTCQLQKENTTTPATWGNVGAAENVTVANMTPTHTFDNLGLGKYRAVFACGGYASVTTDVVEVTAKSTLATPTITATCGGETFEGPVCPDTQVKLTPSVPEGTTGTTTYTWTQSSDNINFAPVTEGVDANGVLTVTASNAPTYYGLSAVNADYCIGSGAAYTLNVNTAAHPNYTIVSNDQDNEVAPGTQVTLTANPESTAVDNTDYTWYYAIAADAPANASGWTEITAQTAGYSIANNILTATISTVPSTWFKVVAHAPTVCTDGSATLKITTTLVLPTLTLDNDANAATAASANVCDVETVELTAAFAVATEGVSYQLEKETATAGVFANEGEAKTTVPFTWAVGVGKYRVVASKTDYTGQTSNEFIITPKPEIQTAVTVKPFTPDTICVGSALTLEATYPETVTAPTNAHYQWQSAASNLDTSYADITDATADTYTVPTTSPAAMTYYRVVVTSDDLCGEDKSAGVAVVVKPTATVASTDFALTAAIGGENVPSGASTELLIGEELNFTVNIATDLPAGVAIPTTFAWTVNDVAQGSTASTFSYAAQTAGPVTVTVKFTPTVSTNYCGSITEQTRTFTYTAVAPTITATIIATGLTDGKACAGGTVILTANTTNVPNGVTPTYAWQKLSGAEYVDVTTDDGTVNGDTLTPTLTAGTTYNYKAVVTVNGTPYTSVPFTFTVKPNITDVTISSDKGTYNTTNNAQTVCYSEKDDIILTANGGVGPAEVGPDGAGPTTTYTWYSVNGNNETLLTTGTTYTLTGLAAGSTTTYRVKATSDYYCGTATKNLTIVIGAEFAKGTIAVTTAPTCESNSAVITWSGATAGSTIQWQTSTDNSDYSNVVASDDVVIGADTLTLNNLAAGTTIYVKALVSNVDYCASNVAIDPATITVNPTATVDGNDFALTATTATGALASVAQVATGTEVTFTVANAPTGVTVGNYAWTINNEAQNSTTNTCTYTGTTAGEVNVTVEFTPELANGYCGDMTEQNRSFTYNVAAATPITVSISANGVANNGSVCSDANVVLTATAENVPEGVTPIYAWEKYNGAGYEVVNGANGNTLTPTLTAGTHTYRAVVTVNNTNYTTDNFTLTVHQPYTANNVSVAIAAPAEVNLAAVPAGTEVTFRAFPTPANLTYTYQWYVNGAAVTDATNATYTYTAPAAGTIGYVECVATLDDGTICKDASWNGEKTSNTAAVTAIADPNALGTFSNFSLVSKNKIRAKLTWTRANESDNVVIIIKPVLSGGLPAGIASGSFLGITQGINADYTAAAAVPAIDEYKVVYKGNNIGGVSTTDTLEITGLSRSTNYTAFAFICNSDYSQNTIEPVRVIFKTNAYKEAYEITDPNFDGEFSLSPINPNPITGDELNFNIDSWVNANYEIELFNSNGDYITGMTQMLSEGIHSMKLDLNSQKGGLNSGAYVLRVTSNGQTLSQPVRIVR